MMPAAVVNSRHDVTRVLRFAGDPMPKAWPEIERMLKQTDGALRLGVWVAIAALAAKASPPGFLLDGTGTPLARDFLARVTGTSIAIVEATIDRLIEQGVLESGRYPHLLTGLGQFIGECCHKGTDAWVPSAQLHRVYLDWCRRGREAALDRTDFQRAMIALGFRKSRSRRDDGGRQMRTWEGLSLSADKMLASHYDASRVTSDE